MARDFLRALTCIHPPPVHTQPIRAEKGSFTLKEPYDVRPKFDFAGLNKSGLVTCPSNQMGQLMEKLMLGYNHAMLLPRTQTQFLGSLEEVFYTLPHHPGKGVHPEAQPDGLEKAVTISRLFNRGVVIIRYSLLPRGNFNSCYKIFIHQICCS